MNGGVKPFGARRFVVLRLSAFRKSDRLRVESAISEFSRADAQIRSTDYLLGKSPTAAVAEFRTLMLLAVNVSSGSKAPVQFFLERTLKSDAPIIS